MQDFDPSKIGETLKSIEPFPSGITTISGSRFFDNSTLRRYEGVVPRTSFTIPKLGNGNRIKSP